MVVVSRRDHARLQWRMGGAGVSMYGFWVFYTFAAVILLCRRRSYRLGSGRGMQSGNVESQLGGDQNNDVVAP